MLNYNSWYQTTVSHIIGLLAINNRRSEKTRLHITFGIHPRLVNLETKKQINKWLADLEILIDAK
jgi:predicted metal-dependent TIM-barrel fold hydrolase